MSIAKDMFKNSYLGFDDFRNSDLTRCKFDNVDLYMANFTRSVNIPTEIETNLSDYEEEDGTISKRYHNMDLVTTNF